MLDNLINAKGGLHNRITQIILLKAFTLAQTKLFLKEKNIKLSDKNILDIYMIIGGVPYYLQELQKSLSVAQNINRLCFSEDAILNTEFDRLFKALFDEAEVSKTIIRAIAEKHKGLSREDLIKATKISSGGTLHKRLRELEAAGFIKSYIPYGYKKRETFYRIIDEYSLFYLRWIEPINQKGFGSTKNQWQSLMQTSSWQSWSGYAFEAVCFKHVNQITKALELENSVIGMSSWRYLSKKGQKAAGAQIDLLLERNDNAFTICEIKYSNKLYLFDKATAKNLANKVMVFEEETKAQKQVFVAMITIFGIKPNIWSEDLVNNSVTLSDLFEF
jgi:hypothetical protein